MYLIDFFKRITRKSNIPVFIYLFLNILIIATLISWLFNMPFWQGLLRGGILYLASLLIALSPIGEWILRLQTGCKDIDNDEKRRFIEPIFKEVYDKARSLDPTISENVHLYMNTDECPNAFATGRKTVCVTEGMLNMPEEQIKATLGHEFGHLAHKDTDLILVVTVGNFIVNTIILGVRFVIDCIHFVLNIGVNLFGNSEGKILSIFNGFYHIMITAIIAGLMWIWTKIGVLLVMKSSRGNEYEADEFSFNLGYGKDLCMLLDMICDSEAKGLFANLASSHPDKDDRIARLQQLNINTYIETVE